MSDPLSAVYEQPREKSHLGRSLLGKILFGCMCSVIVGIVTNLPVIRTGVLLTCETILAVCGPSRASESLKEKAAIIQNKVEKAVKTSASPPGNPGPSDGAAAPPVGIKAKLAEPVKKAAVEVKEEVADVKTKAMEKADKITDKLDKIGGAFEPKEGIKFDSPNGDGFDGPGDMKPDGLASKFGDWKKGVTEKLAKGLQPPAPRKFGKSPYQMAKEKAQREKNFVAQQQMGGMVQGAQAAATGINTARQLHMNQKFRNFAAGARR